MGSKLFFYISLIALIAAGAWGLVYLIEENTIPAPSSISIAASEPDTETDYTMSVTEKQPNTKVNTNLVDQSNHQDNVARHLAAGHFQIAGDYINEHYSEFSSNELENLKGLFLRGSARSDGQIDRLRIAAKVFDDLESWDALAYTAVELKEWQTGFRALMRASELENSSPALELKLENLVKVASHLRASLEQRDDQLGVRDLYQQAYDLHPNYPRLQLELAYAHLQVNEFDKAERLLSALQYDLELGEIAQQTLAQALKANAATEEPEQLAPAPTTPSNRHDIVVALVRAGNSFFIDTAINNRQTRLLLDTGASITALSSDLIERLNLSPTGQVIKLSTANGTRQARLFRTEKLTLGRIQLTGLVVAEIGLGPNSGFEGLLGTDALNQIDSNYSYLIDNKENALIFRRR